MVELKRFQLGRLILNEMGLIMAEVKVSPKEEYNSNRTPPSSYLPLLILTVDQ